MRWIVGAALAALAFGASALAGAQPAPPPHPVEEGPRAVAVVAPYRFDDVLFENERAAYRIYGRALEAREPPSGSGIDAWGKSTRLPFMERQIQHAGSYHDDHGEGADFYNVARSRGVGGLGIWYDNKLWSSRNYRTARILQSGGETAQFEVDYAPWPVDVVRTVMETRRFTLPMGTNFIRMISLLESTSTEPLIVGIGLGKGTVANGAGDVTTDRKRGVMMVWTGTDPAHGAMGTAVLVDPATIVDFVQDAENFLVLVRVTPGQPFAYYAGAGWERGEDFHSRAEWEAYVLSQTPDFGAPVY